MTDSSHLDKKYFIDKYVYNCPFCNRNNVRYSVENYFSFDWTEDKECQAVLIKCSSCGYTSMHLSYEDILSPNRSYFKDDIASDIDSHIFYSVPTSFFVLDERIPAIVRELISEGEGSLKMNYLTGASACIRKAIYELLVYEKCSKEKYDERITELQTKYSGIDKVLFDVLRNIKDMTSDKVHEQSWDKWGSKNLKIIIETLKTVLIEIYVVPSVKHERVDSIKKLLESINNKDKESPQQ